MNGISLKGNLTAHSARMLIERHFEADLDGPSRQFSICSGDRVCDSEICLTILLSIYRSQIRVMTRHTLSKCLVLVFGLGRVLLGQFNPTAERLWIGHPVLRQLAAQEFHYYRINLEAGQFLSVVADQRGIDVLLGLSDTDGHYGGMFYGKESGLGLVRLMYIATKTGPHFLMVRSW